jgi:hypothetical protein
VSRICAGVLQEENAALRRGRIIQPQLDLGAAVPVVQFQLARNMKPLVARVFQRRAERAVEGPEGDGIKRGAAAVADGKLQMAVADSPGADLGIGEGKARGGGGLAEGACVLDLLDQRDGGGGGGEKAVDPQILRALRPRPAGRAAR